MLKRLFSRTSNNLETPETTLSSSSASPDVDTTEFEASLDVTCKTLLSHLSTSQHATTKTMLADELAHQLAENASITLIVAFCGIPTYSILCADAGLGVLLCQCLTFIADSGLTDTVSKATERVGTIISGLIKTEIGQNEVLHYVDVLMSLAVDDRAMTADASVACICTTNVARASFFALAARGYLSQHLHEDMIDKRFLSMLLHKAQAAMERQCGTHAATLAALTLRLLRAQTVAFGGSEALYHFSHDGTYVVISRLLHALPSTSANQEFEDAFIGILSLSMHGDAEVQDDGRVRNDQAFIALHNSVLMSLATSDPSDDPSEPPELQSDNTDHTFTTATQSETQFRTLALCMRVYCLHESNAQRLETRFQMLPMLATTLRSTTSLELVTMVFKSVETIAIAMNFLPHGAFVQLCEEVAHANQLAFVAKFDQMASSLPSPPNIAAYILMDHLYRCISNVLEFKPDYSEGLGTCGIIENVIVPLLSQKCAVNVVVENKRIECLILHGKGLSLLLMFMRYRASVPLGNVVMKRLFDFIRAAAVCSNGSVGEAEKILVEQRADDALAIFVGASEWNVVGLRRIVEQLVLFSLVGLKNEKSFSKNQDLHAQKMYHTLDIMMETNGRVRTMFRHADGFATCVQCIRNSARETSSLLKQDAAAGTQQWRKMIRTILKTMAQSMAGPHAPNRNFVINNIGYSQIARAIVESGILTVEPAYIVDTVLDVFLGVVLENDDHQDQHQRIESRETVDSRQINANALLVVFEILPHLNSEKLSLEAMQRVAAMVRLGGIRCYDTLASAGAVSWVLTRVQKYSANLRREACAFVEMIASHRMHPTDLRQLLAQMYTAIDPRSDCTDLQVGEQLWETLFNVVQADSQVQFTEFVRSTNTRINGIKQSAEI